MNNQQELREGEVFCFASLTFICGLIVFFFCRVLCALQQQEIGDVFVDDFEALGTAADAGDLPGQTSDLLVFHKGFTDKMHTKDRKISCVNWHPTIPGES